MLTPAQVDHFGTFGFLVLRQVFNADEISIIRREADEIYAEDRNSGPIPDTTQYVQPFFERRPYLSTLVDDDRIYEIGVDLVGPDFILVQTEGRSRAGDTPWHGGVPSDFGLLTIKINFYLDDLTKDTGALRFVPGTHRPADPDLYAVLRENNADPDFRPFGVNPSEIPCYTLHSSFGGSPGRQQNAINFMSRPTNDEDVAHIESLYKKWKYGFRPAESYVNSDRPRIRAMVSPLVDWGFDAAPV